MIAVDAHGTDAGAQVVVDGAALAGVPVHVFGPPLTAIGNEDEPALAVRSRADASIVTAARAVADREADALVSAGADGAPLGAAREPDALASAGPTGATLAAAVLYVKRIRGVHRPAVAALLPIPGGNPTLLLDAGANVEVRPEHLVQFAYMGATFMEAVHAVAKPR